MLKTAPGAKRYLLVCAASSWITFVMTIGYYSFQVQPQRLPAPRPTPILQTVMV